MLKRPAPDEVVEQLARDLMPPGGRSVVVRVDDGASRRGLLYRTDAPFPPAGYEFETPEGTYKIEVFTTVEGYALVIWGLVNA